ncbi:MAG TPA: hypothetical protein VJ848_11495, partial [Candidatus Angelobacter sp.]|nr:hypothetical protein [Candidatus Angelobacter sp.]
MPFRTVLRAIFTSVFFACLAFPLLAQTQNKTSAAAQRETWNFVVSGDSRNCGNVIMPAIA